MAYLTDLNDSIIKVWEYRIQLGKIQLVVLACIHEYKISLSRHYCAVLTVEAVVPHKRDYGAFGHILYSKQCKTIKGGIRILNQFYPRGQEVLPQKPSPAYIIEKNINGERGATHGPFANLVPAFNVCGEKGEKIVFCDPENNKSKVLFIWKNDEWVRVKTVRRKNQNEIKHKKKVKNKRNEGAKML